MPTQNCIVDDRVFLLGLDLLYRETMKRHERGQLLKCARRVSKTLGVKALNVPVEGYYAEDRVLTEYFRLARALQEVDASRTSEVESLSEFSRLLEVASAPLFGRPQHHGKLLPVGRDAMSQALIDTAPEWTVERLVAAAHDAAQKYDDFSLVGLAARLKDEVVLAALRESVVLYAESIALAAPMPRKYIWKVSEDLAEQARRFIDAFNTLFDEALPPPEADQAWQYWNACDDNQIIGRCVRLGEDPARQPAIYYHWGISPRHREPTLQEFWHSEVWTTDRYRSSPPPEEQ